IPSAGKLMAEPADGTSDNQTDCTRKRRRYRVEHAVILKA
ncbi:MAG: hypothetical protein QOJ87_1068, partial [Verrucomicrobiota bacterium]